VHADLNDWGVRLAALAQFQAPADGWQAALAARQARAARLHRRLPIAVAAAVLAATVGLAAWLQSTQRALLAGAAVQPVAAVAAEARAESERLERILARLEERRSLRGSTAFTVAELEDRLAFLDDRLSLMALEPHAPERSERLWRERVEILNSLVQVRYADAIGI
jgi:hypothetical protein